MYEFKLQLGCLIILLYFIISYKKKMVGKLLPSNRIFNVLLVVAPLSIMLEGIAAWAVNHQAGIPMSVNLLIHCLFYLIANTVVVTIFLYTADQTIGIRNKKELIKMIVPGAVAQVLIVAFINKLEFIQGNTTGYALGISVVICYLSLLLYIITTLVMVCVHRRAVEKKKLESILYFYILVLVVSLAQVFWFESLITALVPTLAVIGIYISFENPALIHLYQHNEEMVEGFATLVESRDDSTGGHIRRTREYVKIILREMQKHPKYQKQMSEDYIQNVKKAAPMHDIGKISTPDRILLKRGKLDDEEYAIMKEHAKIGGEIIKKTSSELESPDYKKIVYEVARHHHEKWNGRGYPDGLKGEEIPLHSRVMAIADVFDAVSAKRCYREALPIDVCMKIIEDGAGTDFDPELVKIFMDAKEKILAYYESEKD